MGRPEDNPDRSSQHTDTDPRILRDQLNENWRQLRLFKRALEDRDETISTLHEAITKEKEINAALVVKLKMANRLRPWIYGIIGGAVAKLADLGIERIFHLH